MNRHTRCPLLCLVIAGLTSLAAPVPGHAQWDDHCARGCLLDFAGCLGDSGCHYFNCGAGETCIAGSCCDDDRRCRGQCGLRPVGCDRACWIARGICVGGCVPFLFEADALVPEDDVFGPLRERLAAAEKAVAAGIDGVGPAVAPQFEKARAEVRALLKQGKIDPGTALALEASLGRTESALHGAGLRRCVADLAGPRGLGMDEVAGQSVEPSLRQPE